MLTEEIDKQTEQTLRERGSKKWTQYPQAIGAFVAEMDFGTAPAVLQALRHAVDGESFGYTSRRLAESLAESCSRWYFDRTGWRVDPSRVRPAGDVIGIIQYTLDFLIGPGAAVIVPTPTYAPFLSIPPAHGHPVVQVPMTVVDGRYTFDLDALDQAFAANEGALLLLANPHNPTGRVFTRQELDALAVVVDRRGGRVLSDEIHAPLVYAGHTFAPYAAGSEMAAQHSVTAISASKGWNLAGLKCAQIVLTSDSDRAEFERTGYLTEHAASTLGLVANTAAYESGGQWSGDVVEYLAGNRAALGELLATHLPDAKYRAPEATYLAWIDCGSLELQGDPAAVFALGEVSRAVALVSGADCGQGSAGFIRLNFAMPRSLLVDSVRSFEAVVEAARRSRVA